MQFNDTTNNTGIAQDVDFMCGTDTTSYPLADKARNANRWVYKTVMDIIKADKKWLFDDSNHTDLPIFTTTLEDGQNDYSFPAGTMNLEAVEIKDNAGNWHRIEHISRDKMKRTISDFETTSGMPQFYDVFGDTIWLEAAPAASDVTLAKGLKLYITREINAFTAADTTQEPGFAEPFHRIVSLGAAFDWLFINGSRERTASVRQELEQLRQECIAFYGERNMDVKTSIKPRVEVYT